VTDGRRSVPVEYTGELPSSFREGQNVVAMGRLAASGKLKADQILAKHDEKYMPPEFADALKRNGHQCCGFEVRRIIDMKRLAIFETDATLGFNKLPVSFDSEICRGRYRDAANFGSGTLAALMNCQICFTMCA